MKKGMTICAVVTVILLVSGLAQASAFQSGGDRLTALQNNDGGWDWPLDDGDPTSASPTNTMAPITMGLINAYQNTSDPGHLAAINAASTLFLTKQEGAAGDTGDAGSFSPADGYIAVALDQLLGASTHVSHVTTGFYDKLAAGTYTRKGVDHTTASYVSGIRTDRANQGLDSMAAWDIGLGLYAADLAGASTTEWITGAKAEIDEIVVGWYDVLGLAGATLGLAAVGEDFDPTAGMYSAASDLGDLMDTLAGYQLGTGGFTWYSGAMGEGEGNESIQETTYAILALNEFDRSGNLSEILGATSYLESAQLLTGGWENYGGAGENNTITGEALWGTAVPEPATMALLGLGALLLRRKK